MILVPFKKPAWLVWGDTLLQFCYKAETNQKKKPQNPHVH